MKKLLIIFIFVGLLLTLGASGLLAYHLIDGGTIDLIDNWMYGELTTMMNYIPIVLGLLMVVVGIIVLVKKKLKCVIPLLVNGILLGGAGYLYLVKVSVVGFFSNQQFQLGANLPESLFILSYVLAFLMSVTGLILALVYQKKPVSVLGKNPIKMEEEKKEVPLKKEQPKPAFVVDPKPKVEVKVEEDEEEEAIEEITQPVKEVEIKPEVKPKNTRFVAKEKPVVAEKEAAPEPVKKEVVKKEPIKKQPVKKAVQATPVASPKVEVQPDTTSSSKEDEISNITSMGRRVYHLNKRVEDNKWTIVFAGGKRVLKLCNTQKEAIEYVEKLCANNGGTYLIHNSKGKNKGRIKSK